MQLLTCSICQQIRVIPNYVASRLYLYNEVGILCAQGKRYRKQPHSGSPGEQHEPLPYARLVVRTHRYYGDADAVKHRILLPLRVTS